MKSIILGAGEIGNSLFNILSKEYECDIYDISYERQILKELKLNDYKIMHICFPYSDSFIEDVINYKTIFNPNYIVVHSTVPVGTCKDLGVIHSPCIGIHPHLEESMKTFTKLLGGKEADQVADYFKRAGVKVYLTNDSDSTELMKIMSTTYYGMCIEYTKQVKRECDKFKVPFELWSLWTNNYNEGYEKLGYPEYLRPNLVPNMNKIGGHCVRNNAVFIENKFTELIKNE